MVIATGFVCLVFGLIGLTGQLISTLNFSLAQRLGLQEKHENTDPLFRRLELNTAKWDLFVLWALPAAGILMLTNHPWWPYMSLVAGGISVDTAGREAAKVLGLLHHGVRTGSDTEVRLYFSFMGMKLLIGFWCVVYAAATLV